MNSKNVEAWLRSSVSHAAPDSLDDILSACDSEKGKIPLVETKPAFPLRRLGAIAAMFAIVIVGVFAAKILSAVQFPVYPNISGPGGESVIDGLYLPDDVEVEAEGKTAKLYELDMSFERVTEQIERCLGTSLPADTKERLKLGQMCTFKGYNICIEPDTNYWTLTKFNRSRAAVEEPISEDEAAEIAKRFVAENELWTDEIEDIKVAKQEGINADGVYGVTEYSVFFYPDIDGRTVLGRYRISIDVSLNGDIIAVFYLINPLGNAADIELKDREDIAADIESKNYVGDFFEIDSGAGAKIIACELIYYADGCTHWGKTYVFPVYSLIVEGKSTAGETVRASLLIDAQK